MLKKALWRIALVAFGLGSLATYGEGKYSFGAPSALKSAVKDFVGHPRTFGPNLKRLALNTNGVRAIPDLGCAQNPSAILGGVVSEVVDSVDRVVLAGSGSEVFEESLEALSPATTHLDATASPIAKSGAVRVFTALDHLGPAVVFGASFHGHDYNDCRAVSGRKI
jgi:hypothetical protein